jgi:hypothetical protein
MMQPMMAIAPVFMARNLTAKCREIKRVRGALLKRLN